MDFEYNFMKSGEKPNAETMLKRMGEYSACLLTGDAEDLTTLPVDLNLENVLPSNMARVSKSVMNKTPLIMEYSKAVCGQSLPISIVVHFKSFSQFYKRNMETMESISATDLVSHKELEFLQSKPSSLKFTGNALVEIYENLTKLKAKGISKVVLRAEFSEGWEEFKMGWDSYQLYVLDTLERNKIKSNIIRPNFGI